MSSGLTSSVGTVLSLWFGFRTRVDRRAYAISGFTLMAIKYTVDAALIRELTGQLWTPLHYLSPFWTHRAMGGRVELSHLWMLGLWAIPFVWIGVSMTARRAVDSGLSPSWALLFFVPLLNYILILLLCFARPTETERVAESGDTQRLRLDRESGIAVLAAGLVGVALLAAALKLTGATYGYGLFLGSPFAIGFVAAFLYDRNARHSALASILVVQTAILVLGGFILLAGVEGLICLLMALPIAGTLALFGGLLGQAMARARGLTSMPFAAFFILAPTMPLLDDSLPPPHLREVVTSIEIDATPEEVWQHLVTFSELAEPQSFFLRLGIAYPQRARIEGSGVGAVRYCEFSTGPFVEPITRWDEPSRLSFDVIEQPPTMEEWSPYKITPPHVTQSFRSRRGEFRLGAMDGGGTLVEGSTWYQLDIYPQLYWSLWSDWLLHDIHRQVLEHIKRESERASV